MSKTPTIRNVAIIAHVDHGKTSLVDQLLRQSGQFRDSELQGECILDSNDIERERGITILSKNCAINYHSPCGIDYHINIVDTPGHADFSGEVERVLKMADGVLLLVDAFEGVMPQTRYVLSKALEVGLEPIVVINKMDRPDERYDRVHEEVFDLLVELGADDHALDFPCLCASGKDGWAVAYDDYTTLEEARKGDILPLFSAIIEFIPSPNFDRKAPLQMLITSLDYSKFVGRIAVGRVFAGTIKAPAQVAVIGADGVPKTQRIAKLEQFEGLGRKETTEIRAGDLCAVIGLDKFDIGDTLADPANPVALERVAMDEPTMHMLFRVNDSPTAGRDGKFVTTRQLRERLELELQSNVSLEVESRGDEFNVSGRGLLHLSILLETMRREGYELCVGKPEVIYHTDERGKTLEPYEELNVDVPNEHVGAVMQLLGDRKAEMQHMETQGPRTVLEFIVPSRGLIGLRNRMLTATQGEAIMHHRFEKYGAMCGDMGGRNNGVMIATESGPVTAYALEGLADRGIMFVQPGEDVYEGQVVGENCRDMDLMANVCRRKNLTNVRSANKDTTVTLKAPRLMSMEVALEYIEDDELVELTPNSIRIRKRILREALRKQQSRRAKG
ncbi:MAG: translational GTPase TypA [Phycisphaerales bacterium]|jgi:GTP-binding protein|nr:translational GTPase TypA [Phycisphaerales bacterium]